VSDTLKVSRIGRVRELTTAESVAGVVVGDDIDWTTSPVDPGGAGSANFELNTEGGQSVIQAHGSMGSTETFDPTDGNVHTGTLTADCTFTLNVPTGTGASVLEFWLTQDGTGGWDITWPGSVTLQGTLDTTLGTTSRVVLETVDGGTSWVANVIGASGGTPATTVTDETTFGITPAVGTDTEYARQDHTHGTPDEEAVELVGHWEVLMDGGSPPAALESGSGTDWLYVWVPG